MAKGSSTTLTFDYEGALANADDSPVEGLKLAYIGDDAIYLLYPGRWFPVTNYGIDRFTATINVTAPAGITVVGSGGTGAAKPTAGGKAVTYLHLGKAQFPRDNCGRQLSGNLSRQRKSLFWRQQKTVCRTLWRYRQQRTGILYVDLRPRYQRRNAEAGGTAG